MSTLPTQLNAIFNAYVSIQRIEAFLEEEDVPEWASSLKEDTSNPQQIKKIEDLPFGCQDATFTWRRKSLTEIKNLAPLSSSSLRSKVCSRLSFKRNKKSSDPDIPSLINSPRASRSDSVDQEEASSDKPFQLSNLTLSFPRGKMTLIAGPTSSGKSSLLSALLGEMNLVEGSVQLPKVPAFIDPETGLTGAVAYCPQVPYIQQCSIRENILFGAFYESERYAQVLSAAGELR